MNIQKIKILDNNQIEQNIAKKKNRHIISHVSGAKNSILMVTKPTPMSTPTQHIHLGDVVALSYQPFPFYIIYKLWLLNLFLDNVSQENILDDTFMINSKN